MLMFPVKNLARKGLLKEIVISFKPVEVVVVALVLPLLIHPLQLRDW